jgi:ribosome biogenesis GTPase
LAFSYDLAHLGWDDGFAADLPADHFPGRVSRVDRGAADVFTAAGEIRVAYSAAVRRAAADDPVALPCVGDWAAVRDDRAELAAILPRRTSLVRGGVARTSRGGLSADSKGQVLAANVDVVYIAEPCFPDAEPGRVERLLAIAWESGATPIVVLTKADLAAGLPWVLDELSAAAPGVEVHAVSAVTGDGLDAIQLGSGRTAVLLGPSGAGKSTLVNALAGKPVMQTQQIRAADGRGRHTTTHRELLVLPGGGLVIDTPGLRRVGLHDAAEGLREAFSDVEELAAGCRFSDCAHDGEPGCAVQAAVAAGDLPERRLDSWRKLQREAAWMAGRVDARLRAEQTRKWKIIHKEMRRSGRARP